MWNADSDAPAATFTCPFCGHISHNPNDVEQWYCGACHVFVEDELVRRKILAERFKNSEYYRCEFCGKHALITEWKQNKECCPNCEREYNAILAQDCDDE